MTVTAVLGGVLVLAFGILGSAKLVAHPAMRAKAAHVGFTTDAYRRIGALELLAVFGLLGGLVDARLAAAAASGLALLLAGAIATHVRNGDGLRQVGPALLLEAVCIAFVALILTGR